MDELYVEDKKIRKVTVSIVKMVENESTPLRVVPVDILYASLSGEEIEKLVSDVSEVYKRVTGRNIPAPVRSAPR